MKNLFAVLLIVFGIITANCQGDFTPLVNVSGNYQNVDALIIGPQDNIKKFVKKTNRFSNLQSVYLQRGFNYIRFKHLIDVLAETELINVIVECDTMTGQMALLTGLLNTDKITLIEPFILKPGELMAIGKFESPSVSFKSSQPVVLPDNFEFSAVLEELELLTTNTLSNEQVISKLTGLTKFTSLFIAADSIQALPKNIAELKQLKSLEIVKSSEINRVDELPFQKIHLQSQADNKHSLSITYNTNEPFTPAEHKFFSATFTSFTHQQRSPANESPGNPVNTNVSGNVSYSIDKVYSPIIAGVTVPRQSFSVNVSKPSIINIKGGTVINIPSNAFVNTKGEPVTGDVNISYREIKTPAEMLVAGVNMTYDSAGTVYQFESAGNFEILASQNGEPVEIAKGKEITVDFLSTAEGNFNLYKYDENAQNWVYTESANQKSTPTNTAASKNKNVQIITSIDSTLLKTIMDITPYSQRFNNPQYKYVLDNACKEGLIQEYHYIKRTNNFAYSRGGKVLMKAQLVRIKIIYDKKIKSDSVYKVAFTIIPKYDKKNKYNYFPELTYFRKQVFYTDEPMTRAEFRKRYLKNKRYNDIRVEYSSGENTCTLKLKSDKELIELEAAISSETQEKKNRLKIYSFKRKHKRYAKLLNNRIKRLDNWMEVRKKEALKDIYGFRTADLTKYRSITLPTFGLFNCDNPIIEIRRKPPVIENMVILAENNEEINPVIVYVVDNTINGVLTYSPEHVEYLKNSVKKIIAVDKNKNVYCTYQPVNESINKNKVLMKIIKTAEIKDSNKLDLLLAEN